MSSFAGQPTPRASQEVPCQRDRRSCAHQVSGQTCAQDTSVLIIALAPSAETWRCTKTLSRLSPSRRLATASRCSDSSATSLSSSPTSSARTSKKATSLGSRTASCALSSCADPITVTTRASSGTTCLVRTRLPVRVQRPVPAWGLEQSGLPRPSWGLKRVARSPRL